MAIIIEIQQEATKEDCNVDVLLRKAHLAARKLKLDDFDDWLKSELEGYNDSESLPSYRMLHGKVRAQGVFGNWMEVLLPEDLPPVPIRQSVSHIISLAESKGDIMVEMTAEFQEHFRNCTHCNGVFYVEIPKNAVKDIPNQVRNRILDWALDLEEAGVIGEDFSFSDKEVQLAQQQCDSPNTTNFYGNVGSVMLQQDTTDSQQTVQ